MSKEIIIMESSEREATKAIKKALEERPLVDYFTLERFADEFLKELLEKVKEAKKILTT